MNNINQMQYIQNNYRVKTIPQIANAVGLSERQVWLRANKLGLTSTNHNIFDISPKQEQIILSGILGDGGLKPNGLHGFTYRECHAIDEVDYLEWKYNHLHPLTATTNITDVPARRKTHLPQKSFYTTTTTSLAKYSTMSTSEIIASLDELGLLLLMLDDGWLRRYSQNTGALALSIESMMPEERVLLVQNYKDTLGVDGNLVNKNKDHILFKASDLQVFFNVALKYFDKHVDIIQKKFSVCL